MPINHLYDTWNSSNYGTATATTDHSSSEFCLVDRWYLQIRSVCLSRIAGKIPGPAKLLSTTRRLSRLLANPAIQVREWYEPIARQWLETQYPLPGRDPADRRWHQDRFCTPTADRLPGISQTSHPDRLDLGQSCQRTQYSRAASGFVDCCSQPDPPWSAVFLVGDCEFGSIAVLRQLDQWGWFYVLRQKSDTGVWLIHNQMIGSLSEVMIQNPGQSIWLGSGYLTVSEIYPYNLLAHWDKGEKEPWLLATNLPDHQIALRFYRRRMWIEEMFGDFKKHGFDLEHTMLRHADRLSRLTLAVALLYVWLVSIGTQTIRNGLRKLVDRTDRRDLCIFQIGFRIIERCLINAISFQNYPLFLPLMQTVRWLVINWINEIHQLNKKRLN